MRDTLENLYFGNITPNDQIVKSGTALKKAMEQSAECEEKLTALLEDKEKALLLRLINAENEIGSTMALENFVLGFPPGSTHDPGGPGRGRRQSDRPKQGGIAYGKTQAVR